MIRFIKSLLESLARIFVQNDDVLIIARDNFVSLHFSLALREAGINNTVAFHSDNYLEKISEELSAVVLIVSAYDEYPFKVESIHQAVRTQNPNIRVIILLHSSALFFKSDYEKMWDGETLFEDPDEAYNEVKQLIKK